MAPSRKAHGGAVANLNLCHVSAGWPDIAHTGGKSFAVSCDCQMVTRSGGLITAQSEELVEAAIEARRARDLADRKQHTGNVSVATGGPMRDGESLTWQAEDDLLVGHEPRQANAVHRHAALLPTSRARKRLPFRLLMRERSVLAPSRQAPRRRQGGPGRCVELGGVVHLDHLDRVEVRSRDVGQ